MTFLTTRFVDDITNHLKIYRKAKQALDKAAKNEGIHFALRFNINRKSDLNLACKGFGKLCFKVIKSQRISKHCN